MITIISHLPKPAIVSRFLGLGRLKTKEPTIEKVY
jgi:hypothetical protein